MDVKFGSKPVSAALKHSLVSRVFNDADEMAAEAAAGAGRTAAEVNESRSTAWAQHSGHGRVVPVQVHPVLKLC